MSVDLSVVIPAFNEARKIAFDVESVVSFFAETGLKGEVIIVDDGSTDGTAEVAESVSPTTSVGIQVFRLERNRGKGYAVKKGVLATSGDVVLFADSGTCVPYADALPALERIRSGEVDVAIASRLLKETVIVKNRPLKRRILSRFFHLAAVWVTGLPSWITDSQCGFKLYRGDLARKLFKKLETPGYMFELEILLRAVRAGFKIEEFAVHWACDLDTRLRPGSDAVGVWRELLQVRKIVRKNSNP